MGKTKLTATYEGNVFKRSTDREYTHIIIGRAFDGKPGESWKSLSWAGNLDLANRRLNEFKRYGELKIIPVDVNE